MDIADYVILLILLFSAFDGYRTGFVAQLVRIFGVVLAYVAAWKFHGALTPAVEGSVRPLVAGNLRSFATVPFFGSMATGSSVAQITHTISGGVSFGIVFIAALILIRFLGRLLSAVMSLPVLSLFNRVGGLVAGVVVAFMMVAVLINVAAYVPLAPLKVQIRHSALVPMFRQPVQQLERIEGLTPKKPSRA